MRRLDVRVLQRAGHGDAIRGERFELLPGQVAPARIADELFPWLDAPVRRVASLDTWVAYAPQLERAILPEAEDVAAAIEKLKEY
ncbi:MAG: hypothetical protein KY464_15955 [Gemmatimonadetes bacterium]|nr:hypothetical protein [Gemmatimonadota bacterium]